MLLIHTHVGEVFPDYVEAVVANLLYVKLDKILIILSAQWARWELWVLWGL